MLFSIKNRLGPTLLLLVWLAGASFLIHLGAGLPWCLAPYPALRRDVALALGIVLASDALVHGGLWLLRGRRYLARFRALAEYFRPQGAAEIAGAGLLAGGEELFFRGVLLEGVRWHTGAGPALVLSALAFGALHIIRRRELAPFALWAVWEGLLLGAVYLASGSLLTSLLVHAAHDTFGFTLFALVRWLGRR